MTLTIRMDLMADLREALSAILAREGYALPEDADVDRAGEMYFNVMRRRIDLSPRTVLWSAELRGRTDLSAAQRDALRVFEQLATSGRNLNSYLGTTLVNAEARDELLFDWGIHHLCLDPGDGPLLFAVIKSDRLYLLDIMMPSGRAVPWLVEIIHDNWPQLLAGWRLPPKGARPAAVVTSDGTAYAPTGGGYSTDRTSATVKSMSADLQSKVRSLEQWCDAQRGVIEEYVKIHGHKPIEEIRLRLSVLEQRSGPLVIDIEEAQTGLRVNPSAMLRAKRGRRGR